MRMFVICFSAGLLLLSTHGIADAQAGRGVRRLGRLVRKAFKAPNPSRHSVPIARTIVLPIAIVVGLGGIGWLLGNAIGNRRRRRAAIETKTDGIPDQSSTTEMSVENDVIIPPEQTADKSRQTTELMEALAKSDAALNSDVLDQWVRDTFHRVQQSWQERDYSPLEDCLMPELRLHHEELLKEMRDSHVWNRLQNLQIKRLEFVHLHYPADKDNQEVTALITFNAVSYLVDDRTSRIVQGARVPRDFQEFWIFHRQGDNWRLQAIERSHESQRLRTQNFVEGQTEESLQNALDALTLSRDRKNTASVNSDRNESTSFFAD